ncbi:DUF1161 domain-containing protein [Rhodoferax sp.]|uniref:DUF1161 domain-containing protein n=1 Tax=Rhodoferax sp. TaxID=50421 RepID=UPI0025FBA85F|nr:DUF1161 domain-containing protein [Rhodoferax sp.]
MKTLLTLSTLALALTGANAWAAKDCEVLKTELSAKIESHGAKNFTLDVMDRDADSGKKRVVGTCEAGKKKIVYTRN